MKARTQDRLEIEPIYPSPRKRKPRGVLLPALFSLVVLALIGAIAAALFLGDPQGGIPSVVLKLDAETGPAEHDRAQLAEPTPAGVSDDATTPDAAVASGRPHRADGTEALRPAPDIAFVAYGRHGPLPIIAADGRRPMEVYARPFDSSDPRPRIAVVVSGLGLSRTITETAIDTLPAGVTLSFAPYAKDLQLAVNAARAAGHEVMLELPMEPFDYPHNDPGPYTLLTQTDVDENLDKLEWLMSRFSGYAGVINDQGDKLLGSIEDLTPIMKALTDRGLLFLDRGNARRSMAGRVAHDLGIPWALVVANIDERASRSGIDVKLLQLEETARQKGAAAGAGFAYPITIERITAWAESLDEKGLVLAPVSAVVVAPQRQASR